MPDLITAVLGNLLATGASWIGVGFCFSIGVLAAVKLGERVGG